MAEQELLFCWDTVYSQGFMGNEIGIPAIYSKIPLLRTPEMNMKLIIRTLFASITYLFLYFLWHFVPIIRGHHWGFQKWSFKKNLMDTAESDLNIKSLLYFWYLFIKTHLCIFFKILWQFYLTSTHKIFSFKTLSQNSSCYAQLSAAAKLITNNNSLSA